MVSMISRTIGATVSIFLMAIGADVVLTKLFRWKRAYDSAHAKASV